MHEASRMPRSHRCIGARAQHHKKPFLPDLADVSSSDRNLSSSSSSRCRRSSFSASSSLSRVKRALSSAICSLSASSWPLASRCSRRCESMACSALERELWRVDFIVAKVSSKASSSPSHWTLLPFLALDSSSSCISRSLPRCELGLLRRLEVLVLPVSSACCMTIEPALVLGSSALDLRISAVSSSRKGLYCSRDSMSKAW
mmetsp:Transcript_70733/g.207147  ORF Transcript_70733/g.207147 Transcript_70733/m.207147 type:complete len:202 (+) Transcript_70733:41-646(+)